MAVFFDLATNDYLNATGLTVVNNGTFVFSFNISVTGGNDVVFAGDVGSTSAYEYIMVGGLMTAGWLDNSIGYQSYDSGSAKLRMKISNGRDYYKDGLWHRCAVRVDGVDNTIFIDGTKPGVAFLEGNATTSGRFIIYNTRAYIAAPPWATTVTFNGSIGDIRIYTTGLSDSECLAITGGNGNDGIVRNIRNHWRLDELSAGQAVTTIQDLYGDQDATAVNSPVFTGEPIRTLRSG